MTAEKTNDQLNGERAAAAEAATQKVTVKAANVPISRLPGTFFNRRWWWATLLVLALMAVFARLGIWQLSRLEQRRASNAAYLAQISQSPLELSDAYLMADGSEVVDRQAIAEGRYDHAEQIVLTQQSWLGRPGAHLVTPLILDGGETAILVDRGWIPAADANAGDLSPFDEPGLLSLEGVIQLSQTLSGGRSTEVEVPQQEWYRVDVAAIQKQMPYRLLPFFLLQTPPEGVQDVLPYRVAAEVDLSEGPHLGYAIQWFLFAAVLAVGYARFVSTHDSRA